MKSWRAVTGVIGEVLVTLGVVVLLYVGWQLWWTDIDANRSQVQTVSTLQHRFSTESGAVAKPAVKREPGAPFAIVRIPRLGYDYVKPLYEGVDRPTLHLGIGHYPGTAMPGEIGNFSIAGHRMTYGGVFRFIEKIQTGDHVIIETDEGWTVYRITSQAIVDPTHIAAIAPVPEKPGEKPTVASITLTACHPKYGAKTRWVDHGVLEASFTRAQGLPKRYLNMN